MFLNDSANSNSNKINMINKKKTVKSTIPKKFRGKINDKLKMKKK